MVVMSNLSQSARPRFPDASACVIAIHGISEKYCFVALASRHRVTRTTSKGGMFLVALSQWACLLDWICLSRGLNIWHDRHHSALK
jgi:hypothetical protein